MHHARGMGKRRADGRAHQRPGEDVVGFGLEFARPRDGGKRHLVLPHIV